MELRSEKRSCVGFWMFARLSSLRESTSERKCNARLFVRVEGEWRVFLISPEIARSARVRSVSAKINSCVFAEARRLRRGAKRRRRRRGADDSLDFSPLQFHGLQISNRIKGSVGGFSSSSRAAFGRASGRCERVLTSVRARMQPEAPASGVELTLASRSLSVSCFEVELPNAKFVCLAVRFARFVLQKTQ